MIVETVNLFKRFGDIVALNNLNLHVPKGISGFIGPNGAGKTTTINILAGLVKPTSGSATVLGLDVLSESIEIRRRVRFMQELQPLPGDMTVIKFMRYASMLCNSSIREAVEALKTMGLKNFMERKIKSLSAGMMQRLRLAQALLGSPEIIVLDEPTANLDPIGRLEVLDKIVELNKDMSTSFLISSHIIPELEKIVDWISIINDGKIIAEGKISDLISSDKYNVFKVMSSNNDLLRKIINDYGLECRMEGSSLIIRVRDHWDLYKILSSMSKYRVFIYRIEVLGTRLDEIFRKMVGKNGDTKNF